MKTLEFRHWGYTVYEIRIRINIIWNSQGFLSRKTGFQFRYDVAI